MAVFQTYSSSHLRAVSLFPAVESFTHLAHTWMLILEFADVVDILINDDIEAIWLVMRRNVR